MREFCDIHVLVASRVIKAHVWIQALQTPSKLHTPEETSIGSIFKQRVVRHMFQQRWNGMRIVNVLALSVVNAPKQVLIGLLYKWYKKRVSSNFSMMRWGVTYPRGDEYWKYIKTSRYTTHVSAETLQTPQETREKLPIIMGYELHTPEETSIRSIFKQRVVRHVFQQRRERNYRSSCVTPTGMYVAILFIGSTLYLQTRVSEINDNHVTGAAQQKDMEAGILRNMFQHRRDEPHKRYTIQKHVS